MESKPENFIEQIIKEDISSGFAPQKLKFRFPPEPNGYLHIGHAKAIGLNFGLGDKYNAPVNLRFDDTNPEKEEVEYVRAIKDDISWLGYKWTEETYSSDNFQQLYEWALLLIDSGKAYVDSQTSELMAEQKGTPTSEGKNSPYRNRSIEENHEIFQQMKSGNCKEGVHVLRAKIDMAHPNMLMRDPIIYRVLDRPHHRTGQEWKIYPMYDWAHGQCDYIEQVSHSLCSLEFKPHRDLYEWFIDALRQNSNNLPVFPKQREFARLNLSYTIMSKRKLAVLVEKKLVDGWDDPRMPTISGLRRRGYPSKSIRNFCQHIGIAKTNSTHEIELLESFVRTELNQSSQRRMAVIDPVRLTITNWPEGKIEYRTAINNPENESAGTRDIPFSGSLFIEREDFKEDPPAKFFRLSPGREVRLRYGYFVTCTDIVKDKSGKVVEILCTYDPATSGGKAPDGRKVKATIHWVEQTNCIKGSVATYDRLFSSERPDLLDDPFEDLNKESLEVLESAVFEPAVADVASNEVVQFERLGYFCRDESQVNLFHRTVGLRDEWANIQKRNKSK